MSTQFIQDKTEHTNCCNGMHILTRY